MSDPFLENLRVGRNSYRIPLEEFLTRCDPNNKDEFFCFVEADEDKWFYDSKIRGRLSQFPYTITCRKKENVLSVHKHLQNKRGYAMVRRGFFVDRDFDDHLPPDPEVQWDHIYKTPGHSLENFLTQPTTLIAGLNDIFNMQKGVDLDIVANLFERLLDTYHKNILHLNVFLCCQQISDPAGKLKLLINDKTQKVLQNIITNDLTAVYNFPMIENKIAVEGLFAAPAVDQNLWDQICSFFNENDHRFVGRGKFEQLFFADFMTLLKNSLDGGKKNGWSKSYKSQIQLVKKDLLKQFTDRILTPACLIAYIDQELG